MLSKTTPVTCVKQQKSIDIPMSKILDYLYLGNGDEGQNLKLLKSQKITHVINVTDDIQSPKSSEIKFLTLPIKDNADSDISKFFKEANEFIDEARKNEGKVLVHCQAGISRSPTIVIAYLMKTKNLNQIEAYSEVHKIRPIIDPNMSFRCQLVEYEKKKESLI